MIKYKLLPNKGTYITKENKPLKSGDIYSCPYGEIGKVAMRKFECLEPEKEKMEREGKPTNPHTMQHKGHGQYDVVTANGKKLNDNSLTKEEAENLVKSHG